MYVNMTCYFTHMCMGSSYYEYLTNLSEAFSSYLLGTSKLMTSEMTKLTSAKRESMWINTLDVKGK